MTPFFWSRPTQPDSAPRYVRVVIGGFAGMISTIIVHPLDLIKVRMQLFPRKTSSYGMAKRIYRCEGFAALYNGLSAAILRQATYTTTRLGVYYWLFEEYRRYYHRYPALSSEVLIGIYAGMAGALAGNPSELALVRLMADGRRDPCRCRLHAKQYSGVFDALYKVSVNEGLSTLWRGGMSTVTRSILVSIVQINVYAKVSKQLEERRIASGTTAHVITSIISSFVTGIFTLPVDMVKTKCQTSRRRMTPSGRIDDVLQRKGLSRFWQGFVPYFLRMSFHTIIAYILIENGTDLYHRFPHRKT